MAADDVKGRKGAGHHDAGEYNSGNSGQGPHYKHQRRSSQEMTPADMGAAAVRTERAASLRAPEGPENPGRIVPYGRRFGP